MFIKYLLYDQENSTKVTCNLRPEGMSKSGKRIGNQKKGKEKKRTSDKRKMLDSSSEGRDHQNAV